MKRTAAALLAFVLTAGVFSAVPATAFAETETASSVTEAAGSVKTEDEKMKDALAIAKSKLNIPEEYSEFTYRTNERNGLKSYSFTWAEPSGSSSYSADVTGEIITSYSSPDAYRYSGKPSFSSWRKSDYVNKALSWVYRVNPAMSGFLSKNECQLSLTGDNVYVSFNRVYGGAQVSGNSVSVNLNKLTGEVASYRCSWWQGASFPAAQSAVSRESVTESYCREVAIKPWYRVYTDPVTGKKSANIVYTPQNTFVYNALTGEHSTMTEDYSKYLDTDLYMNDDVVDEGIALDTEGDTLYAAPTAAGAAYTKQELAAAEELARMLTSDKFKKLLMKDKYLGITEKYMVSGFSISKDENAECGYAISCNVNINNKDEYRELNITADAKTGKIMSFYSYTDETGRETELDVSKATALAAEAAKYYFGDIFGEYKADPDNTAPVVSTAHYTVKSRDMKFNRYVNNIQVTGDTITVGVNSAGRVTRLYCGYQKDVDFGDGLIVNKENALKLLFAQKDMTLRYDGFTDLKSVPHTYLHYTMSDWSLNGKTGKLCDYYGNTVSEETTENDDCPYTDISDSPYKNEIETLCNYGVKLYAGDKFLPGEKMTADELALLMNNIGSIGYEPIPLSNGKSGNGRQNTAVYFNRAELAKAFTETAGAGSCAAFTSIFKSPFADVSDSDPNIGFIALAYGLGAVSGDKDGRFFPDAYVTREYAYHCAYSYIKSSMEK